MAGEGPSTHKEDKMMKTFSLCALGKDITRIIIFCPAASLSTRKVGTGA